MNKGFRCVITALNVRPINDMNNPVTLMKLGDKIWGIEQYINGLYRVVIDNIYRVDGSKEARPNCSVAIRDSSGVFLVEISELEPIVVEPDPTIDPLVEIITVFESGRRFRSTDFTEI